MFKLRRFAAVALCTALLAPLGAGASLAYWEDYDSDGTQFQGKVWGTNPLTGESLGPPSTWTPPPRPSTMPDTMYGPYYPPSPAGIPRVERLPDGTETTRNDRSTDMPGFALGTSLFNIGNIVNDVNGFVRGTAEITKSLLELKTPCWEQVGDIIPTGFTQEDGSCKRVGMRDALKAPKALFDAAASENMGVHGGTFDLPGTPDCVNTAILTGFDGTRGLSFTNSQKATGKHLTSQQCAEQFQYSAYVSQLYNVCQRNSDGLIYRPAYTYGMWDDGLTGKNAFHDNPRHNRAMINGNMNMCPPNHILLSVTWTEAAAYEAPTPSSGYIYRTSPGQWTNPNAAALMAPKTVFETRLDCVHSDGVTITSVKETGNPGTGMIPKPSCPAGTKPNAVQVFTGPKMAPNAPPAHMVPLPGTKTTINPDARQKFPDCLGYSTDKNCRLKIQIDDKDCTLGMAGCGTWQDVAKESPERVGCFWGTYELTTADCDKIRDGYKTKYGTEIDSERPWDPPKADPDDVIVVPGEPGEEVDLDELFEDPKAVNRLDNCLPSGWNRLNPIEWVAHPVGCALRAAFIPSTERSQARVETLVDEMEDIGIATLGDRTTSDLQAIGAAASASGCMGPELVFDVGPIHQSMHLWQACSEPMSTVASISKALSSFLMIVCGGFGCIRAVAEGFGFRFSMRGSAGDN